MSKTSTPEGIELVPTAHWNTGRPELKAYDVFVSGEKVGRIEQAYETLERRTRGRRYVNARWTASRPRWRYSGGPGIRCRLYYQTRKQAITDLVEDWERARDSVAA